MSDQNPARRDWPHWRYKQLCPVIGELHLLGEYGVRLNTQADEDDRGGHVAWEVWHWPTNSVESDWFLASDAYHECRRLHEARETA